MDDQAMPYVPQLDDPEVIGGRDGELGAGLDHLQRLFLDAGRVLVLGGWLVVTHSFGNPGANAEHVLIGYVLLLLGVFLLTLWPVANQLFPGAAGIGAAVANALADFFAPEN